MGQLRLFAGVVRAGAWQQLRIDPALPERAPLPRPDLRLRMIPVGPVAVFGASNFPLASPPLAETQPRRWRRVARWWSKAILRIRKPARWWLRPLRGRWRPAVCPAVCSATWSVLRMNWARRWSGSAHCGGGLYRVARWRSGAGQSGGIAPCADPGLCRNEQHQPRPADARSVEARGAALGTAFVGSLTMGAGQFCTNPGLLLAIEGEGLDAFIATATGAVAQAPAQVMLTKGIGAASRWHGRSGGRRWCRTTGRGRTGRGTACGAILFQTTAAAFLANPALAHEVFGASSILVRCADEAELTAVLKGLEGQLTATLHMDDGDADLAGRVLPVLERKVGRILANGWPTGVEVCHAMVHGGPFPATSDPRTTSVGSLAIDRFLRPVSYQNIAPALLPAELRDDARGDGAPRLIDGVLTL
jgi:NADP-dependent aldehyde dehydrogenase